MSRAAILLSLLNLMAAAAGFCREMAIAYCFGTSAASDALAIVLLLIDSIVMISFFGLAGSMMVPVLAPLLSKDRQSAFELMESLCVWTVIGYSLLMIPGLVTPDLAARGLGPEFSVTQLHYLSRLLRLSAPAIPLVGVSGIMAGLLQASSSYAWTAIGRLLFSLTIAIAVLSAPQGYRVIAGGLGLTAGATLQAAIQVIGLYRCGWRPSRFPSLRHPSLGEAWRLGLPAVTVFVITSFVLGNLQRLVASGLPEGSIAGINYAMRAMSLIATFSTAVSIIALTELANEFVVSGLQPKSVGLISDQIVGATVWLTPLSVIMFVASEPITWFLFKRGTFNLTSLALCSNCLRWFSLSAVPGLMLAILLRAYASFWLPWRAVCIAALWVGVSTGSTWLLLYRMGAASVPAGFLIGTVVACLVNLLDLGRLAGDFRWKGLRAGALRVLPPAVVAAVLAAWCTVPIFIPGHPWAVQLATLSLRSVIVLAICLGGGLVLHEPSLLSLWSKARVALTVRATS